VPPEQQLAYAVPEAFAAALETRGAASHEGIDVDEAASVGAIGQQAAAVQHQQHLLGIGLPVGGEMQAPAGAEPGSHQRHEFVLDDAALVMALLRPGVGKQQLHFVETLGRNLLLQHLDRVVSDDAQIGDIGFGCGQQQVPDAGTVNLDAEEILPGLRQRALEQMLAVTKADLQRACRNAAEQLRRSAAELWGNHEVTEEYNHSSGGAEPIASPHRIDQRAVGGSRPFGPERSRPARLWGTIATKKRHKQQKFAGLSQNFHDGRAVRSMTPWRLRQDSNLRPAARAGLA